MIESLAGALLAAARTRPATVAIQFVTPAGDGECITWDQLARRGSAVAAAIRERGVRSGDVVFVVFTTGVPLIETFAGIVLAGAVPAVLPFPTPKLDPAVYRERMRGVAADSQPALIVTYPELQRDLSMVLDGCGAPRIVTHEALAGAAGDSASAPSLPHQAPQYAVLQYSSGTTGLQKGVMLSQAALATQVESYARAIKLTSSDVIVSWLPLYHDMGLIAGFLMPLLTGTKLVLMSPFDWVRRPAMLLQAASRHGATLTWLPNFAFNFLAAKLHDRDLDGVRLDCLRAVINCSEPMTAESHERFARRFACVGFRSRALATCYAMAENTFAVTQGGIDGPPRVDTVNGAELTRRGQAVPEAVGTDAAGIKRLLSAGAPIDGVEVRIIGPEGNTLEDRFVGEIAIRSGCMLTEYHRRPDLTSAAFRNGWFLTGDFGYLAEGELYVTGRKKDLIIVGGQNFFPQDIEAAADTVDGVHPGRVVAFGLFDVESGTEVITIVAEVDPRAWIRRDEVRGAIRECVARKTDAIAGRIHPVQAGWLIKTSSGKLARSANKEKYCREVGIAPGS